MTKKHTCEAHIRGSLRNTMPVPTADAIGFRSAQCGNKAKVEHNGKRYCGIHDPVRRAERQAKHEQWALEKATSDLLEACKEMLEGRKGARDKARAAIAKAEGTE